MNKFKKYIFIFLFLLFLFPIRTNAVTNLVGNSGTMGYYINGSYGRAVQFSGNFPIELLTSYSGYYKYLYGVESTFDLSSEFSGTYVNNGAYVYMQLHRGGSQGVMDWTQSNINMRYVSNSHNGVEKQGNCSIHSANNQYITYKCQVEYTNNDYPTTIYMKIGETANFTYNVQPYIGRTMLTDDTSSLYLQAMYFNAYSTNNEEPGTGGSSVDLTDTNEKIDDVKDSVDDVKDSVDDLNDTLTDDNVPSSNDFIGFTEDLNTINITNPLGELMTLPLTFVTRLHTMLNAGQNIGCNRILLIDFSSFTNNSSHKVYLPCFDGYHYFGTSVWNTIDYLMCFYMFYNIVMLFINIYQDIATLSLGTASNASVTSSTSPYGRLKH